MVALNQVIKESVIKGRSVDTEGTRVNGIAEEIIERCVVETQFTMNTENIIDLSG